VGARRDGKAGGYTDFLPKLRRLIRRRTRGSAELMEKKKHNGPYREGEICGHNNVFPFSLYNTMKAGNKKKKASIKRAGEADGIDLFLLGNITGMKCPIVLRTCMSW
jgi:hypothetical protein